MTATVAGVTTPANFSLTNTAGAPSSITATAGTPQSAVINAAFATALQATVKDAGGNPVSGVIVTFTAPSTGASGTFTGGVSTVTATTNASGVATAPTFTANGTTGTYTVTATVAGVTTPANFSLTNTAQADLAVTQSASPSPGKVGTNETWTITVTNNGPSSATNVSAVDTLPAQNITFVSATLSQGTCAAPAGGTVTCSIGTLASGASATATVIVTPTATGQITNAVTVSATEPDPTPADNASSLAVTINPAQAPDFTMSASPQSQTVTAGGTTTYTVTFHPLGGFNQTVATSCTTDAELTTCTMTPTSVPLDGVHDGTATATLVTTKAIAPPVIGEPDVRRPFPFGPISALRWLFAAMLVMTLGALARAARQRRWARVPGFAATAILMGLLLVGCNGGGKPGTPKGAHSVTITGMSGTTTHTVTVALQVN